jgi:predicted AAA+ superfamily ATPase
MLLFQHHLELLYEQFSARKWLNFNHQVVNMQVMRYQRFIYESIKKALADTPVILLNGPRQAGKSTLMNMILPSLEKGEYVTFDDATVLAAARSDPQGFLKGFKGGCLIIDEVQRAPEIFLAIKLSVDRDRRPGRFILTGSANVLFLPQLADSLAGRMEVLPLFPMSLSEIRGESSHLIEHLFDPEISLREICFRKSHEDTFSLEQILTIGGYPEAVQRSDASRRQRWFGSYLSTILQRDVRDLANIEGLTRLPDLLNLLAVRSACLLNYSEISRSSGLPQTTLKRYFSLLQALFLVHSIPAWSNNLSKRLVKSPKIHLVDTGVLCHLLHLDENSLQSDRHQFGRIIETFVVCECLKAMSWSSMQVQAFHYRTSAGSEVDLVLEGPNLQIVGIEVKATHSVNTEDFRGLKSLAEDAGNRFFRGIVLYCGDQVVPFGDRFVAVPIL